MPRAWLLAAVAAASWAHAARAVAPCPSALPAPSSGLRCHFGRTNASDVLPVFDPAFASPAYNNLCVAYSYNNSGVVTRHWTGVSNFSVWPSVSSYEPFVDSFNARDALDMYACNTELCNTVENSNCGSTRILPVCVARLPAGAGSGNVSCYVGSSTFFAGLRTSSVDAASGRGAEVCVAYTMPGWGDLYSREYRAMDVANAQLVLAESSYSDVFVCDTHLCNSVPSSNCGGSQFALPSVAPTPSNRPTPVPCPAAPAPALDAVECFVGSSTMPDFTRSVARPDARLCGAVTVVCDGGDAGASPAPSDAEALRARLCSESGASGAPGPVRVYTALGSAEAATLAGIPSATAVLSDVFLCAVSGCNAPNASDCVAAGAGTTPSATPSSTATATATATTSSSRSLSPTSAATLSPALDNCTRALPSPRPLVSGQPNFLNPLFCLTTNALDLLFNRPWRGILFTITWGGGYCFAYTNRTGQRVLGHAFEPEARRLLGDTSGNTSFLYLCNSELCNDPTKEPCRPMTSLQPSPSTVPSASASAVPRGPPCMAMLPGVPPSPTCRATTAPARPLAWPSRRR